MTTEELLLEKWRTLPPAHQQEVLAFVDRLTQPTPDSPLGQKLRAIRARIIEAKIPLLSDIELQQEIAERRGDREATELMAKKGIFKFITKTHSIA
jgi:hypothetical protein